MKTWMKSASITAFFALPFALYGCGGGSAADAPTAKVVRSLGALACAQGGISAGTNLTALTRNLEQANVKVWASSCGHDGLARGAMCGVPDGTIGVFTINATELEKAKALGFSPMADTPSAIDGLTCAPGRQ